MKLYAIRNRETGEIYRHTYVPIYGTYWGAENHIRESLDSEKYEPVTLRIEPTEPCEFCRDPDDLIVARYKPRKPGDPDPMMVAVEALDPELLPEMREEM